MSLPTQEVREWQDDDYVTVTWIRRDQVLDVVRAAALSSPSVAESPTPKERHLMDVYDSLGVKWGDDPFSAIHRLKAAAESPTWQPIETAPSGTLLLLCSMLATEARQWCYVDWLVLGQLCGDRSRPAPTHWMPLPSAPSPSAAAQQETP